MRGARGFSLVELSIVLVILGLLTGGILGGQSLIKAAELRAVTTELDSWRTAVNSFRGKYNGLPGDLKNAGRFWGYVNTSGTGGNCSNPATNVGTGTQTCSGNGDGRIQAEESFRFWQHLANAGLVSGDFTGVAGTGDVANSITGTNIPASKYTGAGWGSHNFGEPHPGMDGFYFRYNYGNTLFIGRDWFNSWNTGPAFTPEEAWGIDSKVDDGMPTTGTVIGTPSGDCTDATGATDLVDTEYSLNVSNVECPLMFVRSF